MGGLAYWVRRHSQAVMFVVGALLFSAGLATVLNRQLSPEPPKVDAGFRPQTAPSRQGRVGPNRDEPLKPYIDRKKAVLAARASREPRKTSFAIVVFDSYRRASDVDASLGNEGIRVASLQMRIPLPRFEAQEVALNGRTTAEAAAEFTGPAHVQRLTEEMAELRSVASDVDDPAFREVYVEDAEARQKAIELLNSGGATIFAVVGEGRHAAWARIASRTGVRLVDLPEDPGATPQTHEFAGIWPEDTVTARFAVE